MDRKPIIPYSDIIGNDGAFENAKAEIVAFEKFVQAKALALKNALSILDVKDGNSIAKFAKDVEIIKKAAKEIEAAKKNLLSIETELIKQRGLEADALKKELAAERELLRGIQQENATKKSGIAVSEAERRQREASEKTVRREKDAYGEMSAELNKLFRQTASVAVEMYRLKEAGQSTSPEYIQLGKEFEELRGKTLKLDTTLKQIDSTLGRNQRNVGNYKFDALGNSIQQILRESPSAAVSLNTFFLAISNNLPTFFDAVTQVNEGLKELKDIATTANVELAKQTALQKGTSAVAQEAEEALSSQVETLIGSISASKEQAAAIRDQVVSQLSEIETTGVASAETLANTEAVLLNAGATIEQVAAIDTQITATAAATAASARATVAMEAQTVATVEANAAIAAQPSLLKRLGSSLFSLNTAFTVGVLLLTLYGGKLIDYIGSLFQANSALQELTKRQNEYNKAKIQGTIDAQGEIIEVKKYLSVVKDRKISDEERDIALKKLRSQYPFYFKNLTDEQILLGDSKKSVEALIIALEKRKEIEKKTEINVKNKQRIIELTKEIEANDELLKIATARKKVFDDPTMLEPSLAGERNAAKKLYNEAVDNQQKFRKELEATKKSELAYDRDIFVLKKETIGLEFEQKQTKKAQNIEQIKSVDYLASEYELRKTVLENTIAYNEEILSSDKYTVQERIKAQDNLVAQSLVLAKLTKDESLRILKIQYNQEKNETIKDSEGKVVAYKYSANGLLQLAKQYRLDKLKIEEDFNEQERQANLRNEMIGLLDRKQMQIANLKFLQNSLSTSSLIYKKYAKEISRIQTDIENIINGDKGLELSDQIRIGEDELERLIAFRENIEEKFGNIEFANLSKGKQKEYLAEVEKFEKERLDIQQDYDSQRKLNRLKSIEEEQKAFDENSNEFKQLELERLQIEKDFEDQRIKNALDANKKILKDKKDFTKELLDLLGKVIDKFIELANREVEEAEKSISKQEKATDDQRERAQNGLENTLAFEQKQLAKREAEAERARKKAQRLEKIKALYTSYSNYANDPNNKDGMALTKTLRDFAILEAIQASFGDGGLAADKLQTDGHGLTRGRSHQGNRGGIPVMIEGNEGFFSRRAVENFGEDNFRTFHDMLNRGKFDPGMFGKQKDAFIAIMPKADNNLEVKRGLQEVRDEIRNKPVPNLNVKELVNGFLKITETTQSGNKTTRNSYIVKKPRL